MCPATDCLATVVDKNGLHRTETTPKKGAPASGVSPFDWEGEAPAEPNPVRPLDAHGSEGASPLGRAKLRLSRTLSGHWMPAARKKPRPPEAGTTEPQFGAPLQDNTRWLPPTARLRMPLQLDANR